MPFFRKRFVRRPRRKIIRRRSTTKVSRKVRKYVKRELSRQIENKEITTYGVNQSLTVQQSGGPAVFKIPLIPAVSQGTGNNNRIGNTIRPKSCYIKGFVNCKEYNGSTNITPSPVWIRLMLVKALNVTYQGGAPGELDSAIFKGNGAALGFQGNMLDQTLEINTDLFRPLVDKKIKIGFSSAFVGGLVGTTTNYFDNSSMSRPFYINWGKYVKKMVKFNDSSNGNSAQNDNLYLLFAVSTCDGATNSGSIPAECHYNNYFRFEDA